jgi:hypothetical protein
VIAHHLQWQDLDHGGKADGSAWIKQVLLPGGK